MTDLIGAFVFVLAVLFSPHRCRRGWYVEGVRPSGLSTCRPSPPQGCGEPTGAHQQPCPHDARRELVAIYCTGGSHPIVVDYRTVGCTR